LHDKMYACIEENQTLKMRIQAMDKELKKAKDEIEQLHENTEVNILGFEKQTRAFLGNLSVRETVQAQKTSRKVSSQLQELDRLKDSIATSGFRSQIADLRQENLILRANNKKLRDLTSRYERKEQELNAVVTKLETIRIQNETRMQHEIERLMQELSHQSETQATHRRSHHPLAPTMTPFPPLRGEKSRRKIPPSSTKEKQSIERVYGTASGKRSAKLRGKTRQTIHTQRESKKKQSPQHSTAEDTLQTARAAILADAKDDSEGSTSPYSDHFQS
jgi:hypothetical protein